MMTNDAFSKIVAVKRYLLKRARCIMEKCEYNYYSYDTSQCEREMREIQRDWESAGLAGRQEKILCDRFQIVQSIFWKKIKLMNLEMKITELSEEGSALYDDYETARSVYDFEKVSRFYDAYERKEDSVYDLMHDQEQIEQEVQTLQVLLGVFDLSDAK